MFKVGDKISVIHDTTTGKVLSVNGSKVTIEDADGFVRNFSSRELAVVSNSSYQIETGPALELIASKIRTDISAPRRRKSKEKVAIANENNANENNGNEIDLHIEVLFPEAVHWSVADILQKQMIACRSFIEKAVANKQSKVIVIHGKGEGVLKSEIYRYLGRVQDYLHVSLSYSDADFRLFGTGATQVNFEY